MMNGLQTSSHQDWISGVMITWCWKIFNEKKKKWINNNKLFQYIASPPNALRSEVIIWLKIILLMETLTWLVSTWDIVKMGITSSGGVIYSMIPNGAIFVQKDSRAVEVQVQLLTRRCHSSIERFESSALSVSFIVNMSHVFLYSCDSFDRAIPVGQLREWCLLFGGFVW